MKKLVLIDSNAIIHRAYHALPPNMKNSKGELTNAVYGFTTTLIKVLEDLKPDYIAASFDVSKKTFRTEHYAEYKANRVKADQELYDQIPRVKELLEVLDIPIYEKENYEADDVIGTITSKIRNPCPKLLRNMRCGRAKSLPEVTSQHAMQAGEIRNHSTLLMAGKSKNQNSKPQDNSTIQQFNNITIYIVTGDKDLFQLIDDNVFVYSLRHGLSDMVVVDGEYIKKEYNLDPADFIDLKALAGDPSDNIPGVPHIGPKTAISLLQSFDSLQGIYASIIRELEEVGLISNFKFLISNQIPNPNDKLEIEKLIENCKLKIVNCEKEISKVADKLGIKSRILQLLIIYKDQAFLSQRLATIHKDVPIDFDLEKSKWGEYNREKLADFFQEMGFKSLLKRFGVEKLLEVKTETAKKDQQLKLL